MDGGRSSYWTDIINSSTVSNENFRSTTIWRKPWFDKDCNKMRIVLSS